MADSKNKNQIVLSGARTHNLKNIDVIIPKNKFVKLFDFIFNLNKYILI